MSLSSIEYYLEQSLKSESSSKYSLALESCQRALNIVNQLSNLTTQKSNTELSTYIRIRKNSLLLRIRTLKTRHIQYEELNSSFQSIKIREKKDKNLTSILSSTTRLSRPKKNVKFSDNVALIVPTFDDISQPPNEHLIHSFLRKIHQEPPTTASDSDSDMISSLDDIRIGLIECSLCHKRFSKTNQTGIYCSNCHFYMQRFQPTT